MRAARDRWAKLNGLRGWMVPHDGVPRAVAVPWTEMRAIARTCHGAEDIRLFEDAFIRWRRVIEADIARQRASG